MKFKDISVEKIDLSVRDEYGNRVTTTLYSGIKDPHEALLLAQLAMHQKSQNELIVIMPGYNMSIANFPEHYQKALELEKLYKEGAENGV